jgi:hypothetical protein
MFSARFGFNVARAQCRKGTEPAGILVEPGVREKLATLHPLRYSLQQAVNAGLRHFCQIQRTPLKLVAEGDSKQLGLDRVPCHFLLHCQPVKRHLQIFHADFIRIWEASCLIIRHHYSLSRGAVNPVNPPFQLPYQGCRPDLKTDRMFCAHLL